MFGEAPSINSFILEVPQVNNSNFTQLYVKRDPAHPAQLMVTTSDHSAVLPDITPTGRQILNAAQCHPAVEFVLLQELPDHGLEEVGPDEVVQLNGPDVGFYALRTDRLFYLVLNDIKYPWSESVPEAILRSLAGVPANEQIWMERKDEADLLIEPGQSVNLAGAGVERFYSKPPEWKLDVQGVVITLAEPTVTVRHALELANINPGLPWTIILKVAGKPKEEVFLDTVIDLTAPGIERLRVMPKVINNGEGPCARRQFSLLDRDVKFLDAAPYRWETVVEGERRWLLVHDYHLPAGYVVRQITLAIEIPVLYPSAELDMFYCAPAAVLSSGVSIPQADVQQSIFGETFQRWSRHRENKVWSPADDSVVTHLGLVEESLAREVVQ